MPKARKGLVDLGAVSTGTRGYTIGRDEHMAGLLPMAGIGDD